MRHYQTTKVHPVVVANSRRLATVAVTRSLNVTDPRARILDNARLRTVDRPSLRTTIGRIGICTHISPRRGLQVIRTLRGSRRVMTVANSNIGSTPTLGRTRVNVTVNVANASIDGRTDSVILLSSGFTAVITTARRKQIICAGVHHFIGCVLNSGVNRLLAVTLSPVLLPVLSIPLAPLRVL